MRGKQSQAEEMAYVKREDWERTQPVREAAKTTSNHPHSKHEKISLSSD